MDIAPEKISYIFVKFREGDEEAFSFFYKYFVNDLYAYGRSLGAEEKYVMDAVQDVFLKVFFDKPHLTSVEHFKYFLFKSLKNRLYDLFKSKSFAKVGDIDGEVLNFSIKTTVLDKIIEDEDRMIIQQKIEKLLSVLSSSQKEALYLRYIQELAYSEISEMMDKSEMAIRKLVSQAIHTIRKENKILPMLVFIGLLYSGF
ncbi:MAG: RNA polymerase sigma factor [Proteiniphilum sp.]|uniref:RNA polymerase sigma factor n=1 Tax=Proteiniphilum sp. TaxID=1926877 RepID=UPI002B2144BB|nr:RNA polymerase sigma factor [Proteiniphilum sp.]MEA5128158.1 RNA polymerase sigma factor [Proteiniphilum sp.]